jgi:AcrR family transcriptional regulator
MNKSSRQGQKENTHQNLLAVALAEFGRRGIVATRMADIATAAGVSHGTVFAHFETQEALISAVIEETGKRMAYRTHELARHSGSLEEVLASHLEGIREFEPFYTRLVIETRSLPAVAREILVSIQSAISFHISQAAEGEMAAGHIQSMPMALLFNTWMGLVHYYLSNGDLLAPEGGVIERYGPTLLAHFMKLITVDKTELPTLDGSPKNK